MFLSKNQAVQVFRNADALGKRALPTLGSILKFSSLKTLVMPAVVKAEGESTMAQASAEKSDVLDEHGQVVIKDIAAFNSMLMDMMELDSEIIDTGLRITKADLPRLPDWSDDEKKQEKYNAARMDLANLVAGLGLFFQHDDAKTDT